MTAADRLAERRDPGAFVAEHRAHGSGIRRIGYPIGIRTTTVRRSALVSPLMRRVTLGGPTVGELVSYEADDHVKVLLPEADGGVRAPEPDERLMLAWPRPLPPTRAYTVRRVDREAGEVDLDVVLHEGGAASAWLGSLVPGDEVVVAGPPGGKVVPHGYDHHVLAVDATGLPAAARWVEEKAPATPVDLVVEVLDADELDYPLPDHPRLSVTRIVRGETSTLASAVAALALPTRRPFLFAAGEAEDVRPLRSTAGFADRHVSGYWRRGRSDYDED